ncbi:MAG: amidase [Acidobacteria bacterium]|nr:amidase [Acidobacteriota bacterium]
MKLNRRKFLKHTAALALTAAGTTLLNETPTASAQTKLRAATLTGYDATGLAELIRQKKITPLELVEDTLRRIEHVNPQLNLVLTKNFDVEKARARAKASLGDGPFAGVPILLKNIVEYKDADIDFGSRLYAQGIAKNGRLHKASSPFIQAVEQAGFIVVGITNAPEFGLIETTEPTLHGAAHNPWNPAYTTGGSSGGSAASVAAGIVPLAHANDGGGSIRIPACQCGVFGLKPTRKRELTPFTVGGLANDVAGINSDLCVSRSVRDTAAYLNVVENKHNDKLPPVGMVSGPTSKRLKIALVLESINGKRPDPEVELALRASAKLCEALKHKVEEVKLPINGAELTEAFLGYWSAGTVGLDQEIEQMLGKGVKREDVLEPWTIGLMELGRKRGLFQAVGRANKAFTEAAAALEGLFKNYDVILSPVLRIPPYKLGYHDPRMNFDTLLARVLDEVSYTPLHNACGTPAMSVPLAWTKSGLPIGSQFAAWRGGEATLLQLAYELEAARPWAKKRPAIFAA